MKSNKQKVTAQSIRLFKYLLINTSITTTECREKLSIMSPAARIMDLRKLGLSIETNIYLQIDALGVNHWAAQYYLKVRKLTPEQQNILKMS